MFEFCFELFNNFWIKSSDWTERMFETTKFVKQIYQMVHFKWDQQKFETKKISAFRFPKTSDSISNVTNLTNLRFACNPVYKKNKHSMP